MLRPAFFFFPFLLVFVACSSKQDPISCVTALDCPAGWTCEEGFCVKGSGQTPDTPPDIDAAIEQDDADAMIDGAVDDAVVLPEADDAEDADTPVEADALLPDELVSDDLLPDEVMTDDLLTDEEVPDGSLLDDIQPDDIATDDLVPDDDIDTYVPVDECTVNDNPCDDNGDTAATCTDEVVGYTCNCTFGFDPTLGSCHDVDECSLGTDTCSGTESCTNTVGGFACAPNFCGDGAVLRPAEATLLLPFNEGTGTTAADLSGSGNTATLNGVAWVDGRFGKGLSFDGSAAVSISESATLKAGAQLTVTAWIRSSTMPAGYVTIVQKDGVGLRNYGLFITGSDQPALQGTVLFSLTSATPNDWHGPVSSINVIDGNWHHLAGVYNGTEMKLFVDGVERGSQAVSVTPADTDDGVSVGSGFVGDIDEVRLYRRALGTAELAELANRRVHLPFEENDGAIAYDLSGNERNGTLHNAVARTAGRFDGGLFFDGVDDALEWDYAGAVPVNDFTMMAWFTTSVERFTEAENTTTTSGTGIDNHYLFWPDNKDTEAGAGVSVGTNGISVYEHGNGYMPPLAVYDTAIGTGWNHVAVTYTARQPRIYLNGVLVREGLVSPKATVYAPRFAGVTGGFYGVFSGNVDDVRIYDRPLNAVEITAIMQNSYHDELCDDGNFTGGDGCTADCRTEPIP